MENKSTILIVDDEEVDRETLQEILMKQGYVLALAGSGPECLQLAADLIPDVILLDVMMPGMDGYEVCRQLRADPVLAEVPIIMVTSLDDRQARLAGISAGADDFIAKPVDRVELRARIRTITRLNRYRSLLSQRAQFKWAIDHAEDGYLILDHDNRIRYANAQAKRYFRLPQDQQQEPGISFLELAAQHYQLHPEEAWQDWPRSGRGDLALETDLFLETEMFLVQPELETQELFWLQVDLMDMPYEASDGYLVRLHDVTAKVIEERYRWTFQAHVSHKLKTPLTNLICGVELLIDQAVTMSETERSRIYQTIYTGCLQLKDAVYGVFQYVEAPDLARPGRGRCRLAQIAAFVDQIALEMQLDSIRVTHPDFEALPEREITLSPQAMRLILWELLHNARKFHPEQVPDVEIQLSLMAGMLRLVVADNGLTLSPERLIKMWTPYFQGGRYFTGQMPGMGLGLSMIASLVWGAGGTYRAYNRENGPGVVIALQLPLVDSLTETERGEENDA